MTLRNLIINAVAAFACLPLTATARTWKEAGSDRTLEGDYARTEAQSAVIIRPNGTSTKVPLNRLSQEDQQFIAAQEAAAAAPALAVDPLKWETDIEVAKKRAKDEHKAILLDFTGSDWCTWCIRLKKEILSQPKFEEYAKEHLVLVELDFPHRKELPQKEKEQNEKLAKEHDITGYPAVVLLDSRGRKIGRTGYQEGGPEKYIENLKQLLR